ncbi:hypothetical protein F5Y16DRAFT_417248 [Xylariaceae sp. FL0255]|nr:hypothetical protein F5Y16DRAFT_417248 [Xylariaceae sp. FL0255]
MVLTKFLSTLWFICGSTCVSFTVLREMSVLSDEIMARGNLAPDDNRPANLALLRLGNNFEFSQVKLVLTLREHIRVRAENRLEHGDDIFLYTLLSCQTCRATRPYDYVYAMLGMFAVGSVKPDYTKSVKEVYLEAILSGSMEQFDKILQFPIDYGHGYQSGYELPSWIPDPATSHESIARIGLQKREKPLLHSTKVSATRFIEPDAINI